MVHAKYPEFEDVSHLFLTRKEMLTIQREIEPNTLNSDLYQNVFLYFGHASQSEIEESWSSISYLTVFVCFVGITCCSKFTPFCSLWFERFGHRFTCDFPSNKFFKLKIIYHTHEISTNNFQYKEGVHSSAMGCHCQHSSSAASSWPMVPSRTSPRWIRPFNSA